MQQGRKTEEQGIWGSPVSSLAWENKAINISKQPAVSVGLETEVAKAWLGWLGFVAGHKLALKTVSLNPSSLCDAAVPMNGPSILSTLQCGQHAPHSRESIAEKT